jgi:hypothetical protein
MPALGLSLSRVYPILPFCRTKHRNAGENKCYAAALVDFLVT